MPGKDVPEQNGLQSAGGIDLDDPDFIRDFQRPAVIKEDLFDMERRRRVRQVLESRAFRKELEQSIADERKRGTNPNNLYALERLDKLLSSDGGHSASSSRGYNAETSPIADLRGTGETSKYSKHERMLRTKLACLFRLIDHFKWSDDRANHITFRLSADSEELLINPDGVLYHEITAGSLAKVDLQGNILDNGQIRGAISGFELHIAVHAARPDLRCVMLMQTPVVLEVSSMECGLLPICQESMIVGRTSILDSASGLNAIDTENVARAMAGNKVLMLRDKGFIVCGQSIEEVFHLAYHLVLSCETQVRAARVGIENLCIPSDEAQRRAYETAQEGGGGVNKVASEKANGIKWRVGELEWEAWMRVLDNAGHRTGHIYRQPLQWARGATAQSDVEVPPAACAFGSVDEKAGSASPAQSKTEPKVRWLNTPNLYQKVEFEETGTAEPKKITKWIPDPSDVAHSNAIKIDSPHHFTPVVSQNPKEFKEKQKAIKEARRADRISAGPQSKILEDVTWEEAAKLKDAVASGTTEMIVVGAASQGIIDPEYRHNAQMYRQLYQPNPFASITDEEIQGYMKEMEGRRTAVVNRGISGLSDTSFDEYSLMEAARGKMTSIDEDREMTAPTNRDYTSTSSSGRGTAPSSAREVHQLSHVSSNIQPSSSGGWFQRSKSERYGMMVKNGKSAPQNYAAEMSRSTASDEEGHTDMKKEKKKRFKALSFLKPKKDKESKR